MLLRLLYIVKYPYYSNATITVVDWEGTTIDDALVDTLLLNSSRIGHGYAIMKHPRMRQLLRDKDVAIEVNPISNQVKFCFDVNTLNYVNMLSIKLTIM